MPNAIYLVSLSAALVTDVRARRVPNVLVCWLLALGVIGAAAHWSMAVSMVDALGAGAIGLAMWLPFWVFGLLGAGDVKYFAAASLWIGVSLVWRAALLAALLGGLLALVQLAYQRGVRRTAATVAMQWQQARAVIATADVGGSDAAQRTFPYAVPMGLALATAVIRPFWLLNP